MLPLPLMTSITSPKEKTIEEWRTIAKDFGKEVGEMAQVDCLDKQIPARDNKLIHCRIFNYKLASNSPILVFYPGCSFIFNFLEVNSVIASRIASLAKIKVILVSHRLAPENPIRTCFNDCYDAAAFIALNPSEFGVDSQKIMLGGWSSGAHAASYVANKATFKIFHQILLAGSFDYTHSNHEFDIFEAQDPTLKRTLVSHFATRFYSISDFKDPEFSPYWGRCFTHFPPTTFLCGEFDAFRNDTESFFSKLDISNIPVTKFILRGQSHNTIVMKSDSKDENPIQAISRVIIEKFGKQPE